jgi:hypothetical protein
MLNPLVVPKSATYLVFHTAVHSAEHRYSRHIVAGEVESSHKAVGVAEVAGSRSLLAVEEARNLVEGCEIVSTNIKNGGASNPTGSSLAGVGTAEGVVLHILRCIQILGNRTCLLMVCSHG